MAKMRDEQAGMSVSSEFEGAELGDARLNVRLSKVVQALEEKPSESFPNAMVKEAELEGFYRFIRNDKISLDNVLSPHIGCTTERVAIRDEVLIVHDTSEFRFSGQEHRDGLGGLGSAGQGFLGHVSLALAADGSREPLGILAVQTVIREGKSVTRRLKDGELTRRQARVSKDCESTRWAQGVALCEKQTDGIASLIHLMDSEGDIYPLMAELVARRRRFVIRLGQDRLVEGAESKQKLRDFLAAASLETLAERTVELPRRQAPIQKRKGKGKRHAARNERGATLAISSTRARLCRPKNDSPKSLPPTLEIHVVHVREPNPPADAEPVEWILLTTEPVDSDEHVTRVVDFYRARWTVEEYFKALKTGCALQKRQLESWDTLQVAFAIFIPIAWQLLRLRFLSRAAPEAPASTALTPTQLDVLRQHPATKLPANPTIQDALRAIAKLGGHLRSNGPPGWLILGRGYETLSALVVGYRLALSRCDQ
jgi:hypothetical protein